MATEKGENNSTQSEMNRLFIRVEKDATADDIRADFEVFTSLQITNSIRNLYDY